MMNSNVMDVTDYYKFKPLLDMNISYDAISSNDEYIFKVYGFLVPIFFSIVIAVGCVGNVLVILVICKFPGLRTVTNLLLLNLAISDLAFLLICGGFSVAHYALEEWPLGAVLCRLIQYLLYVSAYVTVYTLTAVSLVRYISVVHGSEHILVREKWHVVVLAMIIWLIFLLAKIPILVIHDVTKNSETERLECIIVGKIEGQQLFATFFVFAYALPLAVITTLYLLLVRYMRHQRSELVHVDERQAKVTKTLTVLVLTFAICWLPLHIHLLLAYYGSIPDSVVYMILLIVWHCLAYVNSMLNPIIYNFFSTDFRQGFRRVICCEKEPAVEV